MSCEKFIKQLFWLTLVIRLCGINLGCFNLDTNIQSISFIRHIIVDIHISCEESSLKWVHKSHFSNKLSIEVISCTLLLNLSATSKQGHQLLLIVCYVPLHDVHAWAQQPLKGLHVQD